MAIYSAHRLDVENSHKLRNKPISFRLWMNHLSFFLQL